jgi:hypothetical protein
MTIEDKPTQTKIEECVQIKKQLEHMGILSIPSIKSEVSQAMNAYIQKHIGWTRTFSLDGSGGARARIILSTKGKSGVNICM